MKIFSFFNGKGGVGKTTLTILLAAYITFAKHLRVIVYDLEAPDYRIKTFRNQDLELLETPGTPLNNYVQRNPIPEHDSYFTIEEKDIRSKGELRHFVNDLKKMRSSRDYDVALLDFHALFDDDVPVLDLAREHLMDCVYIPQRKEPQERRSACRAALGLASYGVETRLLWNDIDSDIILRKTPLDQAEKDVEFLQQYGVSFSPVRIKHFRKATQTTDEKCFVRSTICWPEKYVNLWCPELVTLFEEILQHLSSL